MARVRANWLAGDLRRESARLATVRLNLGRVSVHLDAAFLVEALGHADQAQRLLDDAAARLERLRTDYEHRNPGADLDGEKYRRYMHLEIETLPPQGPTS